MNPRLDVAVRLLFLAALATAPLAEGKIPSKEDPVDKLGVSIQGRDIYVLPREKLIYHGTINDFREFRARGPDEDGMEQGTWFGGDAETSAAMSYKKACEQPTLEKKSKLLNVRTLKQFNMILVPYGKTGHDVAAKRIGTRVRNANRMLNGVGVVPPSRILLTELCKTSVYLDGNGRIVAYSRAGRKDNRLNGKICAAETGIEKDPLDVSSAAMAPENGVPCTEVAPQGAPVKLSGWRAPWDQNEIAFCGEETSANTFEITPASLELPIETVGGRPDKEKTCNKDNAPMRTKLVNVTGGAAFDIVFGDPNFWKSVTSVEGYVSMAKDANDYSVGFTNPHWEKLVAWSDALDRVKDGQRPRVKCRVGADECTVEAMYLQGGSSSGTAAIKTTGRTVKYGTNTKVVLWGGD